MTLYARICKALNVKRKDDEELGAFSLRVAKKGNSLPNDDDWNALGDEIQTWVVGVLKAKEAAGDDDAPKYPKLPGWPEEEASGDDDGDTEGDDTAEEEGSEESEESDDAESDEEADEESAEEGDDEDGESGDEEEAGDGDDEESAGEEEKAVDESEDSGVEEESERPSKKAKPGGGGKKPEKTPVKKSTKQPKEQPKSKEKAKPMKQPKAAKAAASNNARTRIDGTQVIKILTKGGANPHREKTKNHAAFAKYKDGMTVDQALKAKIPQKNIYYEAKIGNIKLVTSKKAAA